MTRKIYTMPNETHERIIKLLKIKPLNDNELSQLLDMKQSGMRARISELKSMGYKISRKYTLGESIE